MGPGAWESARGGVSPSLALPTMGKKARSAMAAPGCPIILILLSQARPVFASPPGMQGILYRDRPPSPFLGLLMGSFLRERGKLGGEHGERGHHAAIGFLMDLSF